VDDSYFKIFESKGTFEGSYNGTNWKDLKPSNQYSTLVVYNQRIQSSRNCNKPDVINLNIVSLNQKRFIDFSLSIQIDTSKIRYYKEFKHLERSDSALICSGIELAGASLPDFDQTLASYILNEKSNNFLQITRIAKDTIEGNFELNFIESETFNGRINRNLQIAPNSLQLKSSKFIAITDGLFGG